MKSITHKIGEKKQVVREFADTVLNSYSQVFFSTHRPFALLLLLVTFIDFYAGLFGFVSVLTAAVTGRMLGFNKLTMKNGILGFNSLLTGLGLGIYFSPSFYLLAIVMLASMFTFLISVSLQGVIGKYGLPSLSVPFILGLWAFMLAAESFEILGLNERGIYTLNELYALGGNNLVSAYEYLNNLTFPNSIKAYFFSLSAILFQYNLLTGFIIAIGLLLFSRIAFSLSLVGFFIAYGFYHLIGVEITTFDYSFFGFNYILSSIALGGFFLIPSRNSYFWMILVIPFVAVLTISLNTIFMQFGIPIYALPFNIVVLLFLYSLKFREKYSYRLSEVYFQHNSPEKNLYIFLNNKERFRYKLFTPIKLPFFGTWQVSQAHDGEYTHKGAYRHAWDFIIVNNEGKQFRNGGDFTEDYFCYNKPVIAPEDGVVEEIVDGIDDNVIGKTNLKDNWGNTIIIKHKNWVYSKLSHLKKGSFKVKKGDEVKFGQIIANCGNSGRSPYPHLHFQIQQNPYIGSVTLDYPLSNFIVHDKGAFRFKTHSRPEKEQLVSNMETADLLVSALNFVPGQIVELKAGENSEISWEVKVNEFNQSYLQCERTGAKAFFENDKNLFYFTYFEGNKKSELFYFFQALFKLQKGFYQDLKVSDQYPLYLTFPRTFLWFHDFISPFVLLVQSKYSIRYKNIDDAISPSQIELTSELSNYFLKKKINGRAFRITIDNSGIAAINIIDNNHQINLTR